MKTLVRILTQYVNEDGKPKGGQEFVCKMDDNFFYTDEDVLKEAFQAIIDEKSKNHAGEFTYVSHELIFSEPVVLSGRLIEKHIQRIIQHQEN